MGGQAATQGLSPAPRPPLSGAQGTPGVARPAPTPPRRHRLSAHKQGDGPARVTGCTPAQPARASPAQPRPQEAACGSHRRGGTRGRTAETGKAERPREPLGVSRVPTARPPLRPPHAWKLPCRGHTLRPRAQAATTEAGSRRRAHSPARLAGPLRRRLSLQPSLPARSRLPTLFKAAAPPRPVTAEPGYCWRACRARPAPPRRSRPRRPCPVARRLRPLARRARGWQGLGDRTQGRNANCPPGCLTYLGEEARVHCSVTILQRREPWLPFGYGSSWERPPSSVAPELCWPLTARSPCF